MQDKIEAWMDENKMLPQNGAVIAAVSGGADSVCLLAILKHLAPAHGWKLRALHVNHLIRGDEAYRDEDFVRDLCQKWQVELSVVREDVPALADQKGLSLEETGRMCRLNSFEKEALAWEDEECLPAGSVKVALAHHLNDNAETILHHMLRGSGLRGIGGIRPVQGRLIRPLLNVSREEIRTFLTENSISWHEDSTNADITYTRNRIRNEIIPLIEEYINPHAVENIVNAGRIIAEADDLLYKQGEEIFENNGCFCDGRAEINIPAFLKQKSPIRSQLIRIMLDKASPSHKDVTMAHFRMVSDLAHGESGKRADLPGGLMAGRDYDTLWIGRMSKKDPPGEIIWQPAPCGGVAGDIVFTVHERQAAMEFPKNEWSKWFDYDKISGALSVRTRRKGDYLTIAGGARKSINRLFIDEKVPRDKRDEILLLADGSHIMWVIGMRISEYYKVTDETEHILQAEKKEG